MRIAIYSKDGKEAGVTEISDAVFGVKSNPAVLHQAVISQQANARIVHAHTKTRGEVSGGGKKPWKQKGTGRARHGSIRSPIWRGGGITFGPRKIRNFAKKVNRRMRRAAILMALSDKVASGNLVVLKDLQFEKDKTKEVAKVISLLPLKRGHTMLALPKEDKKVGELARNIDRVSPCAVSSLNVYDLLRHVNLVTTVNGIKEIEKVYTRK